MQITHTDGYPVRPVTTRALRIGMGERYDVIVKAGDGVFPFVAEPAGKSGYATALLRTSSGSRPSDPRPRELDAYATTVSALQAAPGAALPKREPATTQDLVLSGSMAPYVWTINGATYDNATPLTVTEGPGRPAAAVEHVDDVPPDPSARPHVPGRCRRRNRAPEGHSADPADGGCVRRPAR